MNWQIIISAGSNFMSYADSFASDDIALYHEHEEHTGYVFLAESPHLDQVKSRADAYRRASSLLMLLNGAKRIEDGRIRFQSFEVAEVTLVDGDAEAGSWVSDIEDYPFVAAGCEIPRPYAGSGRQRSFTSQLLHVSTSDVDVRSTVFFAGMLSTNTAKERILSWATLYRMVDASKHLSKKMSVDYAEFVNSTRLNEFTAACNNMSVLGLESRHGPSANPAPKKTISSFEEATVLVLEFTSNVLSSYLNQMHPNSPAF